MAFYYRRTRQPGTTARPAGAARPPSAAVSAALDALRGPFIVADLETTGLSTASCEILEFAAVRVGLDGAAEREYAQVVRTRGAVPPFISRLTGITQAEVDSQGLPVAQAFARFLEFVEDLPVFFHNASFDRRFLEAAALQTGMPFANATHCTLALARRAWPELPSHKLDVLARHVGASEPTHRALADVRTTVAVALAASSRLAASD
ncbi:Putative bifunctional exonuclease/endonuclease protein [Achromobacter deleyi]|uniref:Bifunctional exonuclease/endonuclease protein n=1 Tax=Achromobacter deleyi TaxID=1353891 RepID=A0A6S7ANY5_9BURK|nr:3'-5' exonuclease [Achromobacter deleyi]CAB3729081.1 Putative bifunctional exonuclease/endonuclease protein [Achromobacter deleyi]CAB3867248.1 Putative bifunctional exonuclease/endonuclease protein [Achromobacter deleyi]CAB3913474.1 Putative bifunctional exonuclease/endonuclease protein [Achromobacter deleyi]